MQRNHNLNEFFQRTKITKIMETLCMIAKMYASIYTENLGTHEKNFYYISMTDL